GFPPNDPSNGFHVIDYLSGSRRIVSVSCMNENEVFSSSHPLPKCDDDIYQLYREYKLNKSAGLRALPNVRYNTAHRQ
ncbi:unnamed protein product, partial [Rotaria magnacalcarata]